MSYFLMMFELVVLWGFTITLPLLLLLYLTKKNWQPFIKNWLQCSYTIVFIYLGVELVGKIVFLIEQLISSTLLSKAHNSYHLSFYGSNMNVYLIVGCVLIILFAVKLIRQSIGWGIAALLLLQKEELTLAVLYEHRDYYPSSWAIYYHFPFGINRYVFCTIAFNLLALTIYFSKQYWLKRQQATI